MDWSEWCLRFTKTQSHKKKFAKGVSVHWLKHGFLQEVQKAGHTENATIYQIEDLTKQQEEEYGVIRTKGAHIHCPRDGRIGAAYVDCLEGADQVGPANRMLSYSWAYTVGGIVHTLEDYCISNDLDPKRVYVWICCLCNNQHRVVEKKRQEA